jgi:NADPH:quinone reductase-like Zn-dependent oxidoreductase
VLICQQRQLRFPARSRHASSLLRTKDDFATLGQRYDLFLAANGDRSIWDYGPALCADGSYVMTGGSNRQLTDALLFGPLLSMGRQKLRSVLVKPSHADLLVLKDLCEAGQVTPMIDRRFSLSDVPEAVRYVEDGRARGKIVITI